MTLSVQSHSTERTATRRLRAWRQDALWMGVLVGLNVVFFADVLFTNQTFFARDVSTFHYPLKKLVTEAYARGEWPLWNPYVQLGQPLLANPNSMAVYPGQLLFHILPFSWAFELHFVIHCALAGLGTFRLARKLSLSLQAAFLSAVIYNFSGVALSTVNLFNILPVVAFLPWLSVALLWLLSSPSVARACLAILLFGAFLLLLEPLSSLATGLFLCILAGRYWRSLGAAETSLGRLARILGLVFLGSISVAAVQILPTLELLQFSGRKGGLGFSEATFWSLHPVQFLQVLCPKVLGEYFRLEAPVPWPARFFDQREPYLLSCYFGAMAILLAAWGGWHSIRHWATQALLVGMALSFLLALGLHTPLYSALFDWVPAFRYGRFPVKFLLVTNLCLSLLAGTGWASLQGPQEPIHVRRKRWLVAGLAVFAIGLATLYFQPAWKLFGAIRTSRGKLQWLGTEQPLKIGGELVFQGIRHVHLHLGVFCALLLLRHWRFGRPNLLGAVVIAFTLLDLWSSNFWINPSGDEGLYEQAPAAQYLQEREKSDGPFRIFRFEPASLRDHPSIRYETDSVIWISLYRKLTLFPFLAAKDHLAYSVFPSIDRLETPFVQALNRTLDETKYLDRRLSVLAALNVRYVVSPVELASDRLNLERQFEVNSDQPLRLYSVGNPQARAALVTRDALLSMTDSSARASLPPQETSDPLHPGFPIWAQPPAGSAVKISKYSSAEVVMEVECPRESLLVLRDNSYPGWVARVDDAIRPIEIAHPTMRAVGVPTGSHRVVFRFEPESFRRGATISLVSLVLTIASLATSRLIKP